METRSGEDLFRVALRFTYMEEIYVVALVVRAGAFFRSVVFLRVFRTVCEISTVRCVERVIL